MEQYIELSGMARYATHLLAVLQISKVSVFLPLSFCFFVWLLMVVVLEAEITLTMIYLLKRGLSLMTNGFTPNYHLLPLY